jgi:hypothetical protein
MLIDSRREGRARDCAIAGTCTTFITFFEDDAMFASQDSARNIV